MYVSRGQVWGLTYFLVLMIPGGSRRSSGTWVEDEPDQIANRALHTGWIPQAGFPTPRLLFIPRRGPRIKSPRTIRKEPSYVGARLLHPSRKTMIAQDRAIRKRATCIPPTIRTIQKTEYTCRLRGAFGKYIQWKQAMAMSPTSLRRGKEP